MDGTIPLLGRNHTRKPQRVGLLAGGGRFPISFAEAARRQGLSVFAVGVVGMAPDELGEICDDFVTAPLGRIGKAIRLFKRAGIDRVVMAGKVEKTTLLARFRVLRHLPDWRTIHMIYNYAVKDRRDDTLLLAVIREFGRDGIHFDSALEYCPELLVKHGFLTQRKPTPAQWRDIKFGWELAKEMGRLDVGQTVTVSDQAVVAVEAIEGTDACIRRSGQLCKRGKFTVVKVAKPHQDMRFDVPTVGVQTIQTMREAGARVLAIESGRTILLDEAKVIDLANKVGITLVSLNAEELQLKVAS
ncbi:LpxI family protein [Thalassoroseus pseudoceratinae]|uniref:LpxI family protein n=1 Tax=Thalassoroseus pseudoceratinae TaxID=2713176 RepID=UPI0014229C40|nr:UDP-2,3-diacylglucosamine diphosphatase LpxI [Thalassoroseus pseudoceratinae]